jgi:CRISPR-associated endonuclease/helicase Cas3
MDEEWRIGDETMVKGKTSGRDNGSIDLYPFQERVRALISTGKSVILQAPTGSGKTLAALYPFLEAWNTQSDFPRKCIYSVPLRVLADQFQEDYEGGKKFGFNRDMEVTIQTGARPDDPKLEGNLVFTTVDQTLSNFLNIPYAISLSQGNLNAGAVVSSYLVFDELHLFDPETMMPTTLRLLQMLQGIVPFLVMTATLSVPMVEALGDLLNAEPIVLSAEEAAAIPSQHKTRRMHTVDMDLTPEAVLNHHARRSIAICNTVNRAQALFEGLRAQVGSETEVRLLHSRFLKGDRQVSEDWLRAEFGKDKEAYTVKSAILVATQVIEVGLDITSEVLHTELAPAASVMQRAGRCARYQDEIGDVYVYRLPLDRDGNPRYAPYLKEQKEISRKTWDALSARSGDKFGFGAELDVVDAAHRGADRQMLDKLSAQRYALRERIVRTIATQERGAARELIRDVDSRTVIVHPRPESLDNPWVYEGFGIYRGSLIGVYEPLQKLAQALGEDWTMMTAEPKQEEDEASRTKTRWEWREIIDKDDVAMALLVAVNPKLVSYSEETGFRLGVPGDPSWTSPLRKKKGENRVFPPYERETLQQHVTRMLRVYNQPFHDSHNDRQCLSLTQEMDYAARNLEHALGWTEGIVDELTRLVIKLHDLGKLDERWQAWAHQWQERVSALREEDLVIAEAYMAAHTDYDSQSPTERRLSQQLRHLRPNHAAESAKAAVGCFVHRAKDQSLARAAITAIVKHHSASSRGSYGDFEAHPASRQALEALITDVDLTKIEWSYRGGTLRRYLARFDRREDLLPYLLFTRSLRLADQRSQEVERKG